MALSPAGTRGAKTTRAWYVVGLLSLAYLVSILDRVAISLLVTPIKADLQLTDTQLGLIIGLAFGIFYSLVGLPMGRLVDTVNRRNLIVAAILCWSVMTLLSGLAQNYWHLFFARMGVGIGEAVLAPAAWSMVSDLFPPERRAKPLSVIGVGAIIGGGVAFVASSALLDAANLALFAGIPLIGDLAPWRTVLVLAGMPGIVIAIALLTVAEPVRDGASLSPRQAVVERPSLGEVANFIWGRRSSLLLVYLAAGLIVLNYYTVTSWAPTVLVRLFGIEVSGVGYLLGACMLVSAPLGTYLGGMLTDRILRRGDDSAYLRVPMLAAGGIVLSLGLLALAPDSKVFVVLTGAFYFFYGSTQGPLSAFVQRMTPPRMRGLTAAVYLLVVSLIGYVVGPPLVAFISGSVDASGEFLGMAMIIVCLSSAALAIVILLLARDSTLEALGAPGSR